MNIKLLEKNLEFRKNIIVEGNTLSGKTKDVVFPLVDNIIYNNNNILVIDPKNEYFEKYKDVLKAKKYNIVYLNFDNINETAKLNIFKTALEFYRNNEKTLCIQSLRTIADTLIKDMYNKDYTYARNSFVGLVLYLFSIGNYDTNIITIKNIVSKKGEEQLNKILDEAKDDNELYSYLENLYDNELRYKICVLLNNVLGFYMLNQNIVNMINETNINMDINPIAIIINENTNQKYISDIINIYIDIIYNYFKFKGLSLNIIIENFLGHNEALDLENMMLFSISNNIKFIISITDIKQFEEKYGKFVVDTSDIISVNENSFEISQNSNKESYDKELTFLNVNLCLEEAKKNNESTNNITFDQINITNTNELPETTDIDVLIQNINNKLDEISQKKNQILADLNKDFNIDDLDFEKDINKTYNMIDFEDELDFNKKELIDVEDETNEMNDNIPEYSFDEIDENKQIDINYDELINEIDQKINDIEESNDLTFTGNINNSSILDLLNQEEE